MTRNIVINKGDEYRAKTEKIDEKGIFFGEVYKRADSIIAEIIKETQKYLEDSERLGGHKTKYQGMGNNIMAFCAERGQGKTSAMQSYAAHLHENGNGKKFGFEEDIGGGREYCFKVLDPIDPSSLDYGESIIRVLISRLFYEFSKLVEKSDKFFEDEKKFRKEKNELLKMFQKCYENIDFLRKEKTVEEDDLEVLAQLGSSAELKKNLCRLIDKFLKISFDGRNTAKGYGCYLVIQIDDADLCMGNVFEVCENIRNYFSVPNVIVMMAANYGQLKTAIHKKYLEQYEKIIVLQKDSKYADKCSQMASRYLEKMLPAGHRIDLPEVDTAISENSQSLKVLYYKYSGQEKTELFQKGVTGCGDMQEQLLKLLYMKTGIVLLKRQREMHPFLPHTLRELTHFVKMLDGMETVNQRKAFRVMTDSEDYEEIEKLKGNLALLKEYFLNYWCGNHLSYGQQLLISKIVQAGQKMPLVYKGINEYFKSCGREAVHLNAVTYKNILYKMIEEQLGEELELQEAIYFYYTIMLNEWFVRAVEEQEQFAFIFHFIEKPIDLSIGEDNNGKGKFPKYAQKYYVMKFDIKADKLREFMTDESIVDGDINTWLETFCTPKTGDGKNEIPEMTEVVEEKRVWNEDVKELQFDMLQPILTMLLNGTWLSGSSSQGTEDESVSDDRQELQKKWQDTRDDMTYLVSVKNLIANYEIQKCVQKKLDKLCRNFLRRKTVVQWKTACSEVYRRIDSWTKEDAPYLEETSGIGHTCEEYLDSYIGKVVFLCNQDNETEYLKDYKSHLLKMIEEITVSAGKITKGSKNGEMETAELLKGLKEGMDSNYIGVIQMQKDVEIREAKLSKLFEIEARMGEVCSELVESLEGEIGGKEALKKTVSGFKARIANFKGEINQIET